MKYSCCVAALAVACSPVFACGFHDLAQLKMGILNWVYPDSLHVGPAVWAAQAAGKLARDDLALGADLTPEARNQLGYVRVSQSLGHFRAALDDVPRNGPRPNLAVVLLGPVLWSRYENKDGELRLQAHVDGPARGDVVVVTEAPVIRALATGRLAVRDALELGVIRVYGGVADSRQAIDWLSAIRNGK